MKYLFFGFIVVFVLSLWGIRRKQQRDEMLRGDLVERLQAIGWPVKRTE